MTKSSSGSDEEANRMTRDLETMEQIMGQKEKDLEADGQPELDPEIDELAEKKRFTFDIINTPSDPLR